MLGSFVELFQRYITHSTDLMFVNAFICSVGRMRKGSTDDRRKTDKNVSVTYELIRVMNDNYNRFVLSMRFKCIVSGILLQLIV